MNNQCRLYAVKCYSKNKFPFNIGALLIRFFQKTNFSHYALMLVQPSGRVTYFDSTSMGVRESAPWQYRKHYEIIDAKQIATTSYNEFEEFFDKHRGKTYGFGQLVGLLLKLLKVVTKNPFGKGSKYIICNELVILYTNHRGFTTIKDTDSLDLNDTTLIINELSKPLFL